MESRRLTRASHAHAQPNRLSRGLSPAPDLVSTRLRHFSDIVSLMSEPAFLLRADGQIAVANEPLGRLLGVTPEELRSQHLGQLLGLEEQEATGLLKDAFASRGVTTIHLTRKDGQTLVFDAGRLAARDRDEAHLAFLRVRSQGELAERFRQVTRGLAQSGPGKDLALEGRALAQEIAKLERAVNLDALTGLDNRASYNAHLERIVGQARRDKEPVALVLLDIDNFKLVNDRWGHPAGDRCLKAFAEALLPLARRPLDLVARIGGEEFALILPGCDYRSALQIAASARRAVEEAQIAHPLGTLTVSVGVVSRVPRGIADGTRLYEAADQALYEAKRRGKNRVCAAR